MLAQIDTLFEAAQKGANLGGQAILIALILVLGWTLRKLHRDNQEQITKALEAHERQHGELVTLLNAERDSSKKERDTNHETLVRISTESATGLQATAAAINGMTTAVGSLRDTLHGMRGDQHKRQVHQDEREDAYERRQTT